MESGDFWRGLSAPYSSVGYLLMRPRLWRYVALPALVSVLVLALVLWGLWAWAWRPAVDWLAARPGLLFGLGDDLGRILLFLLLALVGAVLYVVVSGVIAAPFYDVMCQKVEAELLADRPDLLAPPATFREGFLHSMGEAARRLLLVIPVFVLGLLLNVIPFVGPPLSAVFTAVAGAALLMLDAFGYPLDRRRVSLRGKLAYAREHRPAAWGVGAGLALLFAVPGAFLFAPLLSSLAGTRTFCLLAKRTPASGGGTDGPHD